MVLPKVHTMPLLLPLSWIYRGIMALRNWAFDTGKLSVTSFEDRVAVIGVGNLVAGGAGKTPHIEYLVRLLQRENIGPIAVLSRGYGRQSHGFQKAGPGTTVRRLGDESYQLFLKFPDITVAVDEKRVRGIKKLLAEENPPKVILLDDCFQHRYVKPGLNICLTSYHRILYADKVIPAGFLREAPIGLQRADMVIVSKCPDALRDEEVNEIAGHLPTTMSQPIYYSGYRYGQLVNLGSGEPTDVNPCSEVLVVTGIADPTMVLVYVEKHFRFVDHLHFGDHHSFSTSDIRQMESRLKRISEGGCLTQAKGVEPIIITTEKDAVRLYKHKSVSTDLKRRIYFLPTEVFFLKKYNKPFDAKIIEYVNKERR
jgi:tetraacyldisaccharide 4'-kinase